MIIMMCIWNLSSLLEINVLVLSLTCPDNVFYFGDREVLISAVNI